MALPLGGAGSAGGAPKDFELCPPGPQMMVCCDVVDVGWIKVPGWGGKPAKSQYKCRLRFMSEKLMKDGKPYLVQRQFTKSAHPNATLRKFLESWRGRPFESDEAAGRFDIEKLIGVNGYITIAHLKKPKGTFAEVMTIMPTPRGMPKLTVPAWYIRVKERPEESAREAGDEAGEAPPDWVSEPEPPPEDNDFPE
jgi:hypothetical protein